MRLLLILALLTAPTLQAAELVVGSKKFTESILLAELAKQKLESSGNSVLHRKQLGGTRVLWNALLGGEIDAYPEYTGTLFFEILASEDIKDLIGLEAHLNALNLSMTPPLGFSNNYALGMKREVATKLGITKISDLVQHPELRFGFGNEFMDRGDGWPSLRRRYGLHHRNVRGLDHDLAYRGLDTDTLDLIDLYSTDAEIQYYDLAILDDDLEHFPEYRAVYLYRSEISDEAASVLFDFAGSLSTQQMIELNAKAKLERISEEEIAAEHLQLKVAIADESTLQRIWKRTLEHLWLVGISLVAAILIALPLGIAAAQNDRLGRAVLAVVGIVQTIPSLALLVLMIPFFGIGTFPAIVALFLYSLLPIVRNTFQGLRDISPELIESAEALGLPGGVRLRRIELPLASRSILAGIKTSTVINIGTATLGALIGAGGYGQPILTGIRLDDISLLLQGAIPAALMALFAQALFDLADRFFVPRGLRL